MDKGKPFERGGRKAMDLREKTMVARLPLLMATSSLRQLFYITQGR